LTTDPFERAAQREHHDELQRELVKERIWRKMRKRRDASGMGIIMMFFGVPYVFAALIRAAGFNFGVPSWRQSLIDFFFGGRYWLFGAFTGWTLFILWVTAIVWVFDRWDE